MNQKSANKLVSFSLKFWQNPKQILSLAAFYCFSFSGIISYKLQQFKPAHNKRRHNHSLRSLDSQQVASPCGGRSVLLESE
jgi:hypothetical protein